MPRYQDPNTLSQDPRQIRARIRRARLNGDEARAKAEIMKLREVQYKPVSEWDMKELARGRPRGEKGTFTGPIPSWVNAEVLEEVARLLHTKTKGKLATHVDLAIDTVVGILKNQEVDDRGRPVIDARTRLEAAKFILEHIIGKPTGALEQSATNKVREIFAQAIVLDDGGVDTHLPAIEGVIVEEDEEEPDGE